MRGVFLPFYLPFVDHNTRVPSVIQARRILDYAEQLLSGEIAGVAITYSANYGQTQHIRKCYDSGEWKTGISGANQAQVMTELESLLENEYQALQNKVRIAPITTMTYDNYGTFTHLQVIEQDLMGIRKLLETGWVVLGWMNQNTSPLFAVGGGIAMLAGELDNLIQDNLLHFSREFPPEQQSPQS